jgi:hypothetical protein
MQVNVGNIDYLAQLREEALEEAYVGDEDKRPILEFMEIYTTDIHGYTQAKFIWPVNMTLIESNFSDIFQPILRKSEYNVKYNPEGSLNITLKTFDILGYNYTNQSMDLFIEFENPNVLGLNFEKSDKLVFLLNESFPILDVLTNLT